MEDLQRGLGMSGNEGREVPELLLNCLRSLGRSAGLIGFSAAFVQKQLIPALDGGGWPDVDKH
jgi:hypothetical protein